jgi:septal ring factor EnvC (AmiA/AmiB activator)
MATAPAVDLEQRLAALETELATAKKDNAQLEKTVSGLQKDLETQQGRLFELKDSLAQAEATAKAKADALATTQSELAEAKQTILKLTAAPAPAPPPTPRRISGIDIVPRRPVETQGKPSYHRGVPEYTPQAEPPNSMLTDADIGWVD